MRFKYSTVDATQHESDSLPWLPLVFRMGIKAIETRGLVDSGATVNVMPLQLGIELGFVWEERKAVLQLSSNFGRQLAIPLLVQVEIPGFAAVDLVFAWARGNVTVHGIEGRSGESRCVAGD